MSKKTGDNSGQWPVMWVAVHIVNLLVPGEMISVQQIVNDLSISLIYEFS